MHNKKLMKSDGRGMQKQDDFSSPFSFIDRFFDESPFDSFSMVTPALLRGRSMVRNSMGFPKVDIEETESEILVTANVPGIDAKNITIEVGDDTLSLSGKLEKEERSEDQKGKIYRYEREYGEFHREFYLPARVNKDGIIAKSTSSGVLTITLPKIEEEKKKTVQIAVE